MTDQERVIQQHMEILALEDKNLALKAALRDALNFAQETAYRAGTLEGDNLHGCLVNYLTETASRGFRLYENYRGLLDE